MNKEKNRIGKLSRMKQIIHLKRIVFSWYDSGAADERILRAAIVAYVMGNGKDTLTRTLWDVLYTINGNGQTTKYLYFNEHNQKLYIRNRLMDWAKLVCEQAAEELKRLSG